MANCTLGTTNNKITMGFIDAPKVRPKSLLKGNLLSPIKTMDVSLILRGKKCTGSFDTVVQGDTKALLGLLSKCICNLNHFAKPSIDALA